MTTLGDYLKELRESKNLSLKDVYDHTGVSDSKLSRIENDETLEPSPYALKKLAEYYGIDVINLYMLAGYLDEKSVAYIPRIFQRTDLLEDEEKELIQHQINLLTKRRA